MKCSAVLDACRLLKRGGLPELIDSAKQQLVAFVYMLTRTTRQAPEEAITTTTTSTTTI